MTLKAVLFIATLAIIGKATSESCGAQFRGLVHKAISLKESCDDAVFKDCCQIAKVSRLYTSSPLQSRIYDISPQKTMAFMFTYSSKMKARCNMESNDGGWTVLVRRVPGGNLTFGKGWTEYENGFGDLNTEFWYGLKNMHYLTNLEPMEVEVEVKQTGSAKIVLGYGHFLIDGLDTKYTLHVSQPKQEGGFDSFAHHNGRKFSTNDNENDDHSSNCVQSYGGGGGWWFGACWDLTLTNTKPSMHVGGDRYVNYDFAELRIRPKTCMEKTCV